MILSSIFFNEIVDEVKKEKLFHNPQGLTRICLFILGIKLSQFLTLMVPWHDIFLFQNMLPINAFINVAFLFFQVW